MKLKGEMSDWFHVIVQVHYDLVLSPQRFDALIGKMW